MSNVVDLTWRGPEEAHSALMDVVAKWKRLGATNLEVGRLLLANAIPFIWDGEAKESLKAAVIAVAKEEIENLFASIGGDAA